MNITLSNISLLKSLAQVRENWISHNFTHYSNELTVNVTEEKISLIGLQDKQEEYQLKLELTPVNALNIELAANVLNGFLLRMKQQKTAHKFDIIEQLGLPVDIANEKREEGKNE